MSNVTPVPPIRAPLSSTTLKVLPFRKRFRSPLFTIPWRPFSGDDMNFELTSIPSNVLFAPFTSSVATYGPGSLFRSMSIPISVRFEASTLVVPNTGVAPVAFRMATALVPLRITCRP